MVESVIELDADSARSLCRLREGMGIDALGQTALFEPHLPADVAVGFAVADRDIAKSPAQLG